MTNLYDIEMRSELTDAEWFTDVVFRDISCLTPSEAPTLLKRFADRVPNIVWFMIGQMEYDKVVPPRNQGWSGHTGDEHFVCNEYSVNKHGNPRYCTRMKKHVGPHVSGIDTPEDATIWEQS